MLGRHPDHSGDPDDPDDTTAFPQSLTVDYVRVYEANLIAR